MNKPTGLLFLLLAGYSLISCLQDPTASNNEPGAPRVQYEDLTRAAITLVGTVDRNDSDASYGFVITEVVDGAETDKKREEVIVLSDGDNAFSWTVDLNVGATYSARAFVSNGISRKYSSAITITTPSTSKATVSNVTLKDGFLMASVKDNGGRQIEEVGFVGGDTPDRKVLLRKEKLPASLIDGESFSLPLSSFELGKTLYFIAYAVDEKEDAGYSPALLEVTVSEQDVVVFEDAQFGSYIVRNFDLNHDGKISFGEIKVIEEIDVSTDNISSVKEIALMPELRVLSCAGSGSSSGKLTALLLDKNPKLTKLNCANNQLEALDISNNSALDTLYCSGNLLASLIVSDNPNLSLLHCYDNKISSLDISNNQEITAFDCHGNQLTQVDIARNTNLLEFDCQSNAVTQLNLSNNRRISRLNCSGNQIKILDVSKNRELESVWCLENPMDTLFLHANQNIEELLVPERTVLFYYISGMSLSEKSVTVPVSEKHTLTAIIDPEDALGKTVTWESSNEDIASVSEDGVITGVAPGTCTITASSYGKTASCSVTVFGGLSLTEETIILPVGETHPLTAVFDPEEAANNAITWSSSNEAIAKVSKDGVVSGISSGLCTITASCLGKTATCSVTVFGGLSLTEETILIPIGETHPLTVVFDPKEAATSEITWSSSNDAIAKVSKEGVVSGISSGICTITASCLGKTSACSVTVFGGISLTEETVLIPIGETHPLTVVFDPKEAATTEITWSSSDNAIATVSENGVVSGVSAGACTITAMCYGSKATCVVTVSNPVTSVSFEESEREVYIGEIFTINAIVTPDDAVDKSLAWESSDPSIATVSAEGAVSPVGVGTAIISATTPSGSTASFNCIVVSEAPVFPDEVFRKYLYDNYDMDGDGFLSRQEAMRITSITVDPLNSSESLPLIGSLAGIEYLHNLTNLSCSNNQLTELDLHNCQNLLYLSCNNNQLSQLDLSNNPKLLSLGCHDNQLSELDISNCTSLSILYCTNNQLSQLDISSCTLLTSLGCSSNRISTLDFSNCPMIETVLCESNLLSSLVFSNCPNLNWLNCQYNQLTQLDISTCTELDYLVSSYNQLSSLVVSNCTNITRLSCQSNQLSQLDVSHNPNITYLNCDNNYLSILDVSFNTKITSLWCQFNQLTQLDLSNCPLITQLYLSSNQLSQLDVSCCPDLQTLSCNSNQIAQLDVRQNPKLDVLYCSSNPNLLDIWLKDGQTIQTFQYDSWTTLHYE